MTQSFNLEEENPNNTSNISWAVFLSDMDCMVVTALIQPRNFRLDMGQYFCTASGSAEHYGSFVFGTSSFLTKGVKKSFQTVLRRNQAFQGASGVQMGALFDLQSSRWGNMDICFCVGKSFSV